MNKYPKFKLDNQWITSCRGKKNTIDPYKPHLYFVEEEPTGPGTIGEVSTILLTNNECPFRCLMCELGINYQTNVSIRKLEYVLCYESQRDS